MGDASDFTFCQVSLNTNDDDVLLESPRVVLDVDSVSLEGTPRSDRPPPPLPLKREIGGANVGDSWTSSSQREESGENLSGGPSVRSRAVPQAAAPAARRSPVARAKVPFEKGFSQMDWLKLTRTHPDLAGLKGKSNRRLISMDEVRQHKTDGSVWTILKGLVYNISPYMKFHPGGTDMLMKAAGKDCTSLFNGGRHLSITTTLLDSLTQYHSSDLRLIIDKYHAWVNAEFLLEKCLVGVLDDSS